MFSNLMRVISIPVILLVITACGPPQNMMIAGRPYIGCAISPAPLTEDKLENDRREALSRAVYASGYAALYKFYKESYSCKESRLIGMTPKSAVVQLEGESNSLRARREYRLARAYFLDALVAVDRNQFLQELMSENDLSALVVFSHRIEDAGKFNVSYYQQSGDLCGSREFHLSSDSSAGVTSRVQNATTELLAECVPLHYRGSNVESCFPVPIFRPGEGCFSAIVSP